MDNIPETRIVLVGRDLKDRDRLWRGTEHLLGRTVSQTGAERLIPFLEKDEGVDILVISLDEGGREVIEALKVAAERDLLPPRVVGFYSHVREEIAAEAKAAGVEAYPRSRFWRELPSLL